MSYYKHSLSIKEQVYRPDHPEVAMAWIGLGNAWSDLGDVRKLVTYHERALAIYM